MVTNSGSTPLQPFREALHQQSTPHSSRLESWALLRMVPRCCLASPQCLRLAWGSVRPRWGLIEGRGSRAEGVGEPRRGAPCLHAAFNSGFYPVFSCFFARAREDRPQSQCWRGFPAFHELRQFSLFQPDFSLFSGLSPFFRVLSTYRPCCAMGRINLISHQSQAVE